jgi:putative membrane protein
MKKLSGGLLIIAATMIASCGNNDNSSTADSSYSSSTTTDSSAMDQNMMADTSMSNMNSSANAAIVDVSGTSGPANFTTHAASGGMMEVELAKTAQQNASSKEVRDLAKMIEQDHKKANDELKKIASSKNITVPSALMSEHQMHVDMLKDRKGADFDKAYVDMMVQAHAKDIEMFRQASTQLSDAELKAFASKTLPTLEKHLDQARSLAGKQ